MEKNFETLQVGAEYGRGDGIKEKIISKDYNSPFPFKTESGNCYTISGGYLLSGRTVKDLVELLTPSEAAKERYTIAPLVFREESPGMWVAEGLNGRKYYAFYSPLWCKFLSEGVERLRQRHDTLEEAQKYCQAHHEAEVKKFLQPA